MSSKVATKPAESGETCTLCGRTHRKVTMTRAGWMGANCQEAYQDITDRAKYNEVNARWLYGDKKVNRVMALNAA